MFVKVAVVILSLGAFAAGLLSLRQSRLQVASEVTQSQLRIEEADRKLWKLRSAIAARVTPQAVEELAKEAGPMRPLALPPLDLEDLKSGEESKLASQGVEQKPAKSSKESSTTKPRKTADSRTRKGAAR